MQEAIAAIDVGSNAIRMVIGMIEADYRPKVVENIRESIRLGADVFTKGSISNETLELAIESFIKFRKLLYKHQVKRLRAVGTSALREATNRDLFIDKIAQASDIQIEVIGGEEEARLVHLAVSQKVNFKNKPALLVDIGGGSVEVILVSEGKIAATESFKMGTVRLLKILEDKKNGDKHFSQLVKEYVNATKRRIKKEIGTQKIGVCIATGGNVESLGDLRKTLFEKDRTLVTKNELETILQKLQKMSMEERVDRLGLRPDRADVLLPASIVLQKIANLAGVKEIQIPHVGLKDGILAEMAMKQEGQAEIRHEQVLASAIQLARKYSSDEAHAKQTARFALQLFDQTHALHYLNHEARFLLEIASLLHDIGHFINMAGHHKHTYYIITQTPLIGLNDNQRAIVANVARYHRKAPPSLRHEGYQKLSPQDRVVVTKLSAILRLADALDTEHASRITHLSVEYKRPEFRLKLEGEGDLLLEKWALLKRSSFFEETFNVKVTVDA